MSVLKYCQFINEYFNKPFLHEKKKIEKIISFALAKDIDIFIITNCTRELRINFEKKTDYRILMSSGKKKIFH